jgi:DNA polymerase-3 subunit epsilon
MPDLSWGNGKSLAPRPSSSHAAFLVPPGPFRFIALDVETANSNASSICQIGLACVRSDGTMHVTSTMVDPEQYFSDFNVDLHGIGPDQVRGAPLFPDVLDQISAVLEDHLIIQHSTFDRRAMNHASAAYGLPELSWRWADSVQIARRAWPEFRGNGGHGLGHLKKVLGLDFQHHDAGEDAKAAALVVLLAEQQTGQTLDELVAPPPKKRQKSRAAVQALPLADKLTALVTFLMTQDPLSRDEVDAKYQTSPTQSGSSRTGHQRAIDNDLGAQIEIVDAACRRHFETGELPAPDHAWRITIILSKDKQVRHEQAFLTAWCRHFGDAAGKRYTDIAVRAQKKGAVGD